MREDVRPAMSPSRSGRGHDHPERPRARDRHPGVREAGEGPVGRGPAEDLREAPRDQAAHGAVLRGDHRDAGGAGEVTVDGWLAALLVFLCTVLLCVLAIAGYAAVVESRCLRAGWPHGKIT